ncbi:MAG TPA: c-type cytochrome [Rhodocyclaceae bacterium]
MRVFAATLMAAAAMAAAPAMAGDSAGLALAKKSNCMTCHAVDKKIVGPAYQDVAKKYAGDKGAEAKLIAKVKSGGSGNWGTIPMPPKGGNAALSDADVATLVKWVLAGAK